MADYNHRKASRPVILKDANGNVLNNKKVRVNQINHEFLFGIGGFEPVAYKLEKDENKKAFIMDRIDKASKIFNYMTLPFYWGMYEKEEGKYPEAQYKEAVEMLKDRDILVKGHPLCWHTVCADWLLKYDDETIMKKQLERIDREVGAFKGLVDIWDVINEVVIMPEFDKYDNAVTRLCKKYGRVGLVKQVFDEARQINPSANLLLNDFNTTVKYEQLIEQCLDAGVSIDTIGIQSHQHQGYWGMEKLEDVLERFTRFGLPIHFTENTFVSGSLIPEYIEDLNDWQVEDWPSTREGEERQRDNMNEMLRRLFAEPLVKGFTCWDLADGAWLGAPAGVLRKDSSIKPSYELLDELINREWHTCYETETDENGIILLEGFKGKYEITLDGNTVTTMLHESSEKTEQMTFIR